MFTIFINIYLGIGVLIWLILYLGAKLDYKINGNEESQEISDKFFTVEIMIRIFFGWPVYIPMAMAYMKNK